MSAPESPSSEARISAETRRLQQVFRRRRDGELYSPFTPGQLHLLQAREREVLEILRPYGPRGLGEMRILEIGCGDGLWLRDFLRWGARPENLVGLELGQELVTRARALLPGSASLLRGNAAYLPLASEVFDLVLQSLVFTSVLEPLMKEAMAREMLRVLKPGGVILWYDYFVNNPRNPEVRGVSKREIRRLFPGCALNLRRVTLAPPVARRLAPYSLILCLLLEKLRLFNTHYLGLIQKP